MKILVAFCCQGGEAMGYRQAGFEVEGIDTDSRALARFPFPSRLGDAVDYVWRHGGEYDAIVGGPPCQGYSKAQRLRGNRHPRLISPFREALIATGRPYVIENVEAAAPELISPQLLCGIHFGLRTDRHRLFETNWPLIVPVHQGGNHAGQHTKMGRPQRAGTLYQAVGNFSGVDFVRQDLGVPWMNRDGIRECVPPVYTRYIGQQLMAYLLSGASAPVA